MAQPNKPEMNDEEDVHDGAMQEQIANIYKMLNMGKPTPTPQYDNTIGPEQSPEMKKAHVPREVSLVRANRIATRLVYQATPRSVAPLSIQD